MDQSRQTISKHLGNALIWVAGSALFAFAPMIFLQFISLLSTEQIAQEEVEHLVEVRYVVFVCCAMCGAVLMSFFRSKIVLKGWLQVFAVYIAPFMLLTYLFLKYLLLYVQLDDLHDFGPGIRSTRLTLIFTFLYCLFAKMIYYKKLNDAGPHVNL